MTKDELMQISSRAGLTYLDGSTRADFNVDISEQLTEFANAILERAAAECDELSKGMQQDDHMQGCIDSAYQVRSLKIKEGK